MRTLRQVGLAAATCATILLVGCSSGPASPPGTAPPTSIPSPVAPASTTVPSLHALLSPSPLETIAAPAPPSMPPEVLGTWTGPWDELPGPYGSTSPLTFTVTLQPCTWSTPCGRQDTRGTDASGGEIGCGWDLYYNGLADEPWPGTASAELGPWLRFREGKAEAIGTFKGCSGSDACRDYVRLRPDGILEFGASCAEDSWQGTFELRRDQATPAP